MNKRIREERNRSQHLDKATETKICKIVLESFIFNEVSIQMFTRNIDIFCDLLRTTQHVADIYKLSDMPVSVSDSVMEFIRGYFKEQAKALSMLKNYKFVIAFMETVDKFDDLLKHETIIDESSARELIESEFQEILNTSCPPSSCLTSYINTELDTIKWNSESEFQAYKRSDVILERFAAVMSILDYTRDFYRAYGERLLKRLVNAGKEQFDWELDRIKMLEKYFHGPLPVTERLTTVVKNAMKERDSREYQRRNTSKAYICTI